MSPGLTQSLAVLMLVGAGLAMTLGASGLAAGLLRRFGWVTIGAPVALLVVAQVFAAVPTVWVVAAAIVILPVLVLRLAQSVIAAVFGREAAGHLLGNWLTAIFDGIGRGLASLWRTGRGR